MNYVNVKFGQDCRSKIISGVNLCADAVQTTFGNNGTNSIILTSGGVKVTKDGYHTALEVNDADPYVTMGIKLVQDTCKLTAKSVGDGSSSTAILIRDLVNNFSDNPNPIQLTRNLKLWGENVIKELESQKLECTTKEDLEKVATISANNDTAIGKIVAEAFDKVGQEGVVTIEESEDVIDRIDYSDGFRIDRGYSSPYLVNTSKNTCELENVYVYISETKIEEIKKIADIAERCIKNKQSLLLMAPNFDSEIIIGLSNNMKSGVLNSCTVITPGRHNMREEWLTDLRILLGESSICQKVILTKDHTTFIGCNSDKEAIENRVKYLREKIEAKELNEYDLKIYKKRLANFTSGIATIYVGGYSYVDMKERYDRIEDSVCATQAAMTDGVLPGGGVALRKIADNFLGYNSNLFFENTDPQNLFYCTLRNFSEYLNTEEYTTEEMIKNGVIDPFLVEKTVIENAIATASLILTANVAIVNMNTYLDE